jgi:sugar phosphate isomerase/epimerase
LTRPYNLVFPAGGLPIRLRYDTIGKYIPKEVNKQCRDPVFFIEEFPARIFHCHVKDSRVQLNGRNSILSSHLDFGDPRRGWDFVSPGRGDVKWDPIIRAFNRVGYKGPLSIEWEDSGMDREWGAPEALKMIRTQDFAASSVAFDAAFASQ